LGVSEPKRIHGPLLAIVGVALIALVALVLISLRKPMPRAAADDGEHQGTVSPAAGAQPGQAQVQRPWPRPQPPAARAPVAAGEPDPALPSPTRRVEAPTAIPPEVANEKDPAKRAELLKMHRLTTARVRASMLRRRRDTLQRSIDEARKQGTWPEVKLREAQKQLGEVADAVTKAEARLEQVRQEVGGDIDKGSR